MSATSCIAEHEPIILAAGWCISDVLSFWAQVRGCFLESGRECCEAVGCRWQPAFFVW